MKLLYTAFLLIFCAPLISQTSRLAPIQGNPALRSHVAKEDAKKARLIEQMTGYKMLQENEGRIGDHCPPETPFGLNVVESGSSIVVTLDTFGLLIGAVDTVFTVMDDPAPQFGTATLLDNTIQLQYEANDGIQNLEEETIQVEMKQGSQVVIISVTFTIKRKGVTEILPNQVLEPEEIAVVCLDGFLNFDSPLSCAELVDCPDDYPGNGNQFFYLSSFPGVDTCVIYEASRFPGVDTVCITVCDELAVCDEFKIPFEIPFESFEVTATNPFFDDFSSYSGPFPSEDFWLDESVFVNTTLADNPPSVGLVTFDGLNRRGQPYDILNTGRGDVLTSRALDLSAFSSNDPLALRYFVAPKGYGQEPEPSDSLLVEFLNEDGEWIEVAYETGISVGIDSVPPFGFRGIEIDAPQFLHDRFQFRFAAKVSPGGYGDWWHLDYVFLGQVDATTDNFLDIAFSKLPNTFLTNYTSLPFRHLKGFEEAEVNDEVKITAFNLFEDVTSITSSSVQLKETTSNTNLNSGFSIVDGQNLQPMVPEYRVVQNPQVGSIRTAINGLTESDEMNIEVKYSMNPNADADIIFSNDTVRLNTPLSNYFAHDDGTAELAYFIPFVQGFEQVAQRYRANVTDSIKAVQIMFPHFTLDDFESQFFNLKIWVDDNDDGNITEDEVVLEQQLMQPFFPDAVYDTLQGFTTYILEDFTGLATPVEVPAGKDFYVGWQYASAAGFSFPVGFDLQNDCGCIVEDLNGGGFEPFAESGSIMVRPVMEQLPFNTSTGATEAAPTKAPLQIYPNPTQGILNLKLEEGQYEDFKLLVFNQLGQVVAQPLSGPTINLEGMESGIYYLQISDKRTGAHFVKRFIFEQ